MIFSADWSIRRLQSWTCSSLPTVAEFVKLTQCIVIEIQRQSADLYEVQLCNRQFFVSVPAIYVVKVYECHPLGCRVSQNQITYCYFRPVSTKWEISWKISFPNYNQIHVVQAFSFKMIYYMSGLLPYLGYKTYYFLEKFLYFLLISDMFSAPYLLKFSGDLSLILWEQVSFLSIENRNSFIQRKDWLIRVH